MRYKHRTRLHTHPNWIFLPRRFKLRRHRGRAFVRFDDYSGDHYVVIKKNK